MDAATKRTLKSRGQTLRVEAWLGKEGIHPAMVATLASVFEKTDLVKVRIGAGEGAERKRLAQALADEVGAEVVSVTGRNALLYKTPPVLEF